MSQSRVSLVLEGPSSDVMEVVSLALSGNLIQSLNQEAPTVTIKTAPVHRQNGSNGRFKVGDRVKVLRTDRANYDVEANQVGRVLLVPGGRGRHAPVIAWDNGTEGKCAPSMLKKIY